MFKEMFGILLVYFFTFFFFCVTWVCIYSFCVGNCLNAIQKKKVKGKTNTWKRYNSLTRRTLSVCMLSAAKKKWIQHTCKSYELRHLFIGTKYILFLFRFIFVKNMNHWFWDHCYFLLSPLCSRVFLVVHSTKGELNTFVFFLFSFALLLFSH